jgi:hypothetical protein
MHETSLEPAEQITLHVVGCWVDEESDARLLHLWYQGRSVVLLVVKQIIPCTDS